jgi:hypothetical protein
VTHTGRDNCCGLSATHTHSPPSLSPCRDAGTANLFSPRPQAQPAAGHIQIKCFENRERAAKPVWTSLSVPELWAEVLTRPYPSALRSSQDLQ